MARKPTDTVALQVRLVEGLRRKLASSAEKNGRSLNSEIVWRLGQSFGSEGAAWSDQHETSEKGRDNFLKAMVNTPEFRWLAAETVARELAKIRGKGDA